MMYISEIDQLLEKLEIAFPHKPTSRIKLETQYKYIIAMRDYMNNTCYNDLKFKYNEKNK